MNFDIYHPSRQVTLNEFVPLEENPADYIPTGELMDAVNVALQTGMPLLLTGEPGTGKTSLAFHLADRLNLGEPLVQTIRTTTTYNDLFYEYNALGHYHYVHIEEKKALTEEELRDKFIRFNALGEAILSDKRRLVLLDEIDKAPRDLPNDILYAIENMCFEVPELNRVGKKKIRADRKNRPVVILTSNSEKNLPDPFLRRCVFFHIRFPDEKTLIRILAKKLGFSKEEQTRLVHYFLRVRSVLDDGQKKPATAELIQWSMVMERCNFPVDKLILKDENGSKTLALNEKLEDEWWRRLRQSFTLLAKTDRALDRLIAKSNPDLS